MESEKKEILPSINVNLPNPVKKELVHADADKMGSMIDKIMDDINFDSDQINLTIGNFMEMVMQGGDSSGSTKESLVALLKIKADQADKKIKIMELVMKAYLKDSSPKITAKQNNQINIDQREMIKSLND